MRAELRHHAGGVLVGLAFVGLWQGAVSSGVVHYQYLPAPDAVVAAGVRQLRDGALLGAAGHTLVSALIAWGIALLVGGALGMGMALSAPLRALLTLSVDLLRTLPVIAFVPIAALLFGLSRTTEVTVAAWSALWPIAVNTVGGLEGVHARLGEVGAVLQLGRARRLWAITLPAAAPLMLVGARLGLGLALIVTVAAEMIANPAGLGYEIVQMQQALRPDAMFAYILVVGVVGLALNAGLQQAAARAVPATQTAGGRS
jgi:sulfonate transport system permease protein